MMETYKTEPNILRNDQDSTNGLICNMLDAGCCETEVEKFCECFKQGYRTEELLLLAKRRDELLCNIHIIRDSLAELEQAMENIQKAGGRC